MQNKQLAALSVYVTMTPEESQQGLQGQQHLANDVGLLVALDTNNGLWMKETTIPLSAAFISEQGTILDIIDLEPLDESVKAAPEGTVYALEVNKGWFGEYDIGIGDSLGDRVAISVDGSLLEMSKGGPGSGNFGHAGRPGQIGGSSPGNSVSFIANTTGAKANILSTEPDEVLGDEINFVFGDITVQTHIREAKDRIYLTSIGTKYTADLTKRAEGTGKGLEIVRSLKAYADKTSKALILPDATNKAAPLWDSLPFLERAFVEVKIDGRTHYPPISFIYIPPGSELRNDTIIKWGEKGGPGSGNFGHAGRPGKRGGSQPGIKGGVLSNRSPEYYQELYNSLHLLSRMGRGFYRDEHLFAIDENGQVISRSTGNEDVIGRALGHTSVTVPQNVWDADTIMHNHPRNYDVSFSDSDVGGFLQTNAKHFFVVTNKGTVYRLSKTPNTDPSKYQEGWIEWRIEQETTEKAGPYPHLLPTIREGLTADDINSVRIAIVQEAANKIGLEFAVGTIEDFDTSTKDLGKPFQFPGLHLVSPHAQSIASGSKSLLQERKELNYLLDTDPDFLAEAIAEHSKGGPGSGHHGHAGRPGQRGGSAATRTFYPAGAAPSPGFHPNEQKVESFYQSTFEDFVKPYYESRGWDQPVGHWTETHVMEAQPGRIAFKSLEEESGVDAKRISDMTFSWNSRSTNEDMRMLHLQEMAAEEFGLTVRDSIKERIAKVRDEYIDIFPDPEHRPVPGMETADKYGPFYYLTDNEHKSILRAMYNHTQSKLAKAGFKPGDTIRVYRGFTRKIGFPLEEGQTFTTSGNPLQSWSISSNVAEYFASGSYLKSLGEVGYIISMDVPVESILSVAGLGLGRLYEGEVVIFGNGTGHQVSVTNVFTEGARD